MAHSGTASAPITFQPYQNEQVTITGLDVVNSGWSHVQRLDLQHHGVGRGQPSLSSTAR